MSKIAALIPHPDDEIIGLFCLLQARLIDYLVVMTPCLDKKTRILELGKSMEHFKVKYDVAESYEEAHNFLMEFRQHMGQGVDGLFNKAFCFAPDPVYEVHPLHKKCSAIVDSIFLDDEVFYYSTLMNTPYLVEVGTGHQGQLKRSLLTKLYSSQASLWENDFKYWIFEGYRKKVLSVTDIRRLLK